MEEKGYDKDDYLCKECGYMPISEVMVCPECGWDRDDEEDQPCQFMSMNVKSMGVIL